MAPTCTSLSLCTIGSGVVAMYLISTLLRQPIPELPASGTEDYDSRPDGVSRAELYSLTPAGTAHSNTVIEYRVRELGSEGGARRHTEAFPHSGMVGYEGDSHPSENKMDEPGRRSRAHSGGRELASRDEAEKHGENQPASAARVNKSTSTELRDPTLRVGNAGEHASYSGSLGAERPIFMFNASDVSAATKNGLQSWTLLGQVTSLVPKVPPWSVPFLHQSPNPAISGDPQQQDLAVRRTDAFELACSEADDMLGPGHECERPSAGPEYNRISGVPTEAVPTFTSTAPERPDVLGARDATLLASVDPGRSFTPGTASDTVKADHGERENRGCHEPSQRTSAEARRRNGESSFVPLVIKTADLPGDPPSKGSAGPARGRAGQSNRWWTSVWLVPCRLVRKGEAVEYMLAPGYGASDFSSYRYIELLVDVQRLDQEGGLDVGEVYVRKNNHREDENKKELTMISIMSARLCLYSQQTRLYSIGCTVVPAPPKWPLPIVSAHPLSQTVEPPVSCTARIFQMRP